MAEYQRGRQLHEQEVQAIVSWLEALTGDIPANYIKEPALPKSTATTPKPKTQD
jgi:cytochrome c peroxidase